MKYYFLLLIMGIQYIAGAQSPAIVLGDSLYAIGNYTKAIKEYERVEKPDAHILLQIARAYKGKGQKSAASIFYEKSLAIDSLKPIAQTEYGRLLLSRSKFSAANDVFTRLTESYPDNPEYFYQLGKALKYQKQKDTIFFDNSKEKYKVRLPEEAFVKAVLLDSTHQKAMYELSKTYLSAKDYSQVEKIARKALETEPENVEIISVLAQNYYYKGWWIEAIEFFNKLIDLGQSTRFIHNNLGRSYYKKRENEKAIEQYEIVLGYDDEDWGTHLILARLYNFGVDKKKALYHAERALYFKNLPLDDVYFTTGRIYEKTKEFEKAMKMMQLTLKENPDKTEAYYGIAIAADNYYKDKNKVLALYDKALEKYNITNQSIYLIRLIEERRDILKREIFMDKEKE